MSASAGSISDEHGLDAVGVLEVDADRAAAAVQDVGRRAWPGRRPCTFWARSTRMTSAPMSASIMAQNGPGPMPAISMILSAGEGSGHGGVLRAGRWVRPTRRTAGGERGDGLDERAEVAGGQVVAHALEHEQLGAGDELGGALAAARGDQRVDVAVDHQRRAPSSWRRPSARLPDADDGEQLAGGAGRVEAAVVGGRGALGGPASSSKCVGAADDLAGRRRRCVDGLVAGGGAAAASSIAIASGVGWPTSGSPVVDMIEVSVRTRSGCSMAMVWAIIPPIEAPTTWAESMPRWSSSADGVGGHVGQAVGRPRPARPGAAARNGGEEVAADVVELGGQADVAVVVADHAEAAVDEGVAELDGPGDELGAEAHHEQQRLAARVAVGLVAELDPVGLWRSLRWSSSHPGGP